jgi:hypothetical protein
LIDSVITHVKITHEFRHLLAYSSARLPTTFEPAVKAMVTDSIARIDNKAATLAFVITARRIETNPTAWSLFTLSG